MDDIEVLRFIEKSFEDWRAEFDNMTGEQMSAIERRADIIAIAMAMLSTYASSRNPTLMSDTHEKSLSRAQSMRKKIRKALGYTYP